MMAQRQLSAQQLSAVFKGGLLFHRRKRTPGKFMMRLKVPNGELTSDQLRFLGDCIAKYGDDGCADITTRANIQLRGVQLEDADSIMSGLVERGLSSVMSGMDNVRNITGSPIAGIDPHELLDTRPLCHGESKEYQQQFLFTIQLQSHSYYLLFISRDAFFKCHFSCMDPRVSYI